MAYRAEGVTTQFRNETKHESDTHRRIHVARNIFKGRFRTVALLSSLFVICNLTISVGQKTR
jgi:hypothetical protein